MNAFEGKIKFSDLPIVEKLPAEWYDPAEDEEWENYLREGDEADASVNKENNNDYSRSR
jgi:hypothetical protein